ncbi:MAG: hypothetical protein Q8Q12_10535 [bacterium]|nr:hypothetical protein [bacterium]
MKRIGACLAVCLCVAVLFGLGVTRCHAQAGIVVRPQPGVGEGLRPAQAEVVMPFVEPGPPRNVWVEAIFIEMDRASTRDFEKAIGFKLSPPDGKAILNAEEKEKILASVAELDEARIIASLTILTISGQQAQAEQIEEVTYATEYEYKEGAIIPGNWETRGVGGILNVTPSIGDEGLITLVLMPAITVLTEWLEIDGTGVTQPIFKTWSSTTTVHLPNGTSFVLKDSPYLPFHMSQASNPGQEVDPEDQTTLLTIISAKIVEVK